MSSNVRVKGGGGDWGRHTRISKTDISSLKYQHLRVLEKILCEHNCKLSSVNCRKLGNPAGFFSSVACRLGFINSGSFAHTLTCSMSYKVAICCYDNKLKYTKQQNNKQTNFLLNTHKVY